MNLTPIEFKQQTTVLNSKNAGGTGKIPVHVSSEKGAYISKWQVSFWDAVRLVFMKKRSVWFVVYGRSHPVVMLTVMKNKELFQ